VGKGNIAERRLACQMSPEEDLPPASLETRRRYRSEVPGGLCAEDGTVNPPGTFKAEEFTE